MFVNENLFIFTEKPTVYFTFMQIIFLKPGLLSLFKMFNLGRVNIVGYAPSFHVRFKNTTYPLQPFVKKCQFFNQNYQ